MFKSDKRKASPMTAELQTSGSYHFPSGEYGEKWVGKSADMVPKRNWQSLGLG